ncbi:MAG TPA: SufD family Fe-S cluster assembly protein [Steroidobacteraceae bacterium]
MNSATGLAPAARPGMLDRVLREYHGVAELLPGDAQARAARARAAAQLTELGWPSWRDEHWRYANLRAFEHLSAFSPCALAEPPSTPELRELALPAPTPGFTRLLYVDGVHVEGAAPQAGGRAPDLPHAWPAEQRLGLLCDMFATDAARLRVRGEAAIEVVFATSGRGGADAAYPRLQVQLEPGSRLELIERHVGEPAAPALVACNVTLELARDAMLSHYRLQHYGRNVLFADTLWAALGEGARYGVRSVSVGAGTARTSALVQLGGRAAALNWQAIAAGRGEQMHDTALKVEHGAPDADTVETFRGIADGRARVAFSGHINIHAAAPGSQARQSLRGLIEGAGAEIDLRPRLEILTDEVRAVHGATTGRLDEDLLFYLLARGIDRQTARALLKWAFLSDVLREFELPALRAEAERLTAGQLEDVQAVGALS